MKSKILSIGTATPANKMPQMQIAEFMADALQFDERERKMLRKLYHSSGIQHRYSVLADYATAKEKRTFFSESSAAELFPGVQKRMKAYQEHALPLAFNAVQDCLQQYHHSTKEEISHLITVSCTGMHAPGLDIELINKLGLNKTIQRTGIQFMGCHAAINAVKVANDYCLANPGEKALIVCAELCSLHFQNKNTRDHLLANALFGDGAAALLIGTERTSFPALTCEAFYSHILPDEGENMAWNIGDYGFEMKLSGQIPSILNKNIKKLVDNLLQKAGLKTEDVDLYAIHPGGKKILEACEQQLDLTSHDNKYAYDVLADYGNMSSPTILFILKKIMKSLNDKDVGKRVLSLAFGPGITVETTLFNITNV